MKIRHEIHRMVYIDGIINTVTGYTFKPGVKYIQRELSPSQYKDFQIYMAIQLAKEFERAIDTQRYKGTKWAPLTISYLTYKQRMNYSLNIWEATGYMKDNITVYKKGNFLGVGFPQDVKYKKTGLKVNNVARYVEYGTNRRTIHGKKTMSARPLFRPILAYVRKHIDRYYRMYLNELSKANKMGKLYVLYQTARSKQYIKAMKFVRR